MSHPDRMGPKKPRKGVNKQRGHRGQRFWGGHKPRIAVSIAFIAMSWSRARAVSWWGSEQERGEVKIWKARGWEAALPRCQLRGSKAEIEGEFMDSILCWLRWEKRLKELMKKD